MGLCAAHRHRLDRRPPKLTVRTGFGIYYDRGEFFSYLSPQRRRRLQRTVRRHSGAALCSARIRGQTGATFATPFGTTPPAPPAGSAAAFQALAAEHRADRIRQLSRREICSVRSCSAATTSTTSCLTPRTGPSIFNTKRPTTGCSAPAMSATMACMRSCRFRSISRSIATPQHPINGQIYSYGGSTARITISTWSRSPPASTPATLPSACPISATT